MIASPKFVRAALAAAGLALLTAVGAGSSVAGEYEGVPVQYSACPGCGPMYGPYMGQGPYMGPGMMGPGMMMPYGPTAPGMMGQGMGPGMMGPGMMGPGMMMPYVPTAPGMMGPGMMGPGMMPYQQGAPGMMMPPAVPGGQLDADSVRAMIENRLAWDGNPRLKVGEVRESEAGTIVADIVTTEGALVDRLEVDPRTGWMRRAQ
ncbi:MAG TPA: hypothetical protein VGA50_18620 [Kiloniellales bacterium]